MIEYHEPLFRPPAEADSLIFQVSIGCPHNTCRFCPMYKTTTYNPRELEDVLAEISSASSFCQNERRVFLADGDALALPFEHLAKILSAISSAMPQVSRVNSYANASSILAFTDRQLEILRALKLNTLYIGLESGSQELLDHVGKKETVANTIKAARRIQQAGMKASVMILLGLAGKHGSVQHANNTADAINSMQPRILSALRFVEIGTPKPLFNGYATSSEHEILLELKIMLENLNLDKTVFRANHSSNPLPLAGRLPQDKKRLVAEVQSLIDSSIPDKQGPGRLPMWL